LNPRFFQNRIQGITGRIGEGFLRHSAIFSIVQFFPFALEDCLPAREWIAGLAGRCKNNPKRMNEDHSSSLLRVVLFPRFSRE
jgi:hypothetical protein